MDQAVDGVSGETDWMLSSQVTQSRCMWEDIMSPGGISGWPQVNYTVYLKLVFNVTTHSEGKQKDVYIEPGLVLTQGPATSTEVYLSS